MDPEKRFKEDYLMILQQESDRIHAEFDFSEGSTFRLVWDEATTKTSSEAATSQEWLQAFRIVYSDFREFVIASEHPPDFSYHSTRKIDLVVKKRRLEKIATPPQAILRMVLRIFLYAEVKNANADDLDTREAESQGWSAAEEAEVSDLNWVFTGYGGRGIFSIHKAGEPLLVPMYPLEVHNKNDYADLMNHREQFARMFAHTVLLPWPTEEELIMIKNDFKDYFG
ncbi:hypothetical protein GGI42DRAFT_337659 [Trichoderma sp. SZMC 28013]